MKNPSNRRKGIKRPTSQTYVSYKSTVRNVIIVIQRDANAGQFKTFNTVSNKMESRDRKIWQKEPEEKTVNLQILTWKSSQRLM